MRRWASGALLLAALGGVAGAFAPTSSVAATKAACAQVPAIDALEQMAAGVPVGTKKVGDGWDAVVLGRVTEVRHKSPKFRYRITMLVDSTLGAELPAVYTFFGSSRGTYPFLVGSVYAVPVARRTGRGPLLPTTELWLDECDPVIVVSDLPVAHDVIARTKPGYRASPSPTPVPVASPTIEVPAAAPLPAPAVSPASPRARAGRGQQVAFPDRRSLQLGFRRAMLVMAAVVMLVALIAAAESWWSRRHYA